MNKLELKDLNVFISGKQILMGVNIEINEGEVVVLMGPNGAGKSTISNVIIGNPKYKVMSGQIILNKKNITSEDVTSRAKQGIFMSFQHPIEIDGVTMSNFLRSSYNNIKGENVNVVDFQKLLNEKMTYLGIDSKFRGRSVNKGFSGGEKKRSEVLQMMLFEPKFAILDEIDSGLDVDALKTVSQAINMVRKDCKTGILIITHYNKILDYVKPDRVYVLKKGEIVEQGDFSLAKRIEKKGFE